MKLNNLLPVYFSKSLLKNLMFCLFISGFFIFLIDLVELSRRITKSNNSDFLLALELAILKLPGMVIEIFPFIVLFASLSTFFYFAKRSELIVARSSGLSIWHLLVPGISLILIIGFFTVILIQPFIATSSYKFKELEAKTIRGQTSLITITENGLWLKDTDINNDTYRIINSQGFDKDAKYLGNVIFFNHSNTGQLISRYDADKVFLKPSYWELENVWVFKNLEKTKFLKKIEIRTNLTAEQIQENFAPPETISFWNLPEFIKIAENAGFAATKHKTEFQSLLALPLFLCSMLIIAAPFSVRFIRSENVNYLILSGIVSGLILYTFSNVIFAFGASGNIGPILSAWSPPILAILLGITAIIYVEEG
tara:strand:+ start:1081 stop:2181 length:1101 start_codon:yes stop_codon:yes gene_type:complete